MGNNQGKRRFVIFAGIIVGLCAMVALRRFIAFRWENTNFINFLAAWIPFVLSILLAFIPDKDMKMPKRIAWRTAVVVCGLFYSLLLWHQQTLVQRQSETDQARLLKEAVDQSNQHSDNQIADVRKDVKGVKGDIKDIKGDLATTTRDLGNLVNKSKSDISSSIEKISKPVPPELAQLQFSFFSDRSSNLPFLSTSVSPDKDGNFPVDVTFTNTSSVTAEEVDIWLEICGACSFAAEPAGFDRPNGVIEQMRHRVIHVLNPGASMEKISLLVKSAVPITPTYSFEVAFTYSCKTCGKKPLTQKAKVWGRP